MIRGPENLVIEAGCGEREEIGRIRKAGRQAANPAERFDPEGGKSPEGEWRQEAQSAGLVGEAGTGQKR